MSQLPPFLTPIAPQCATSGPTTLLVKGGSGTLGATSGSVFDASGNLVFKIRPKLMTMSGRYIVKDTRNAEIGQAKRNHMNEWFLGTMDNVKKCSVKCTSDRTTEENRHKWGANIYLGETVIGEAHGNWKKKSFKISLGGDQVAEVMHRRSQALIISSWDINGAFEDPATKMGLGVDYSYCLEIVAGIDAAFIVMVVTVLDEIDAAEPGCRK